MTRAVEAANDTLALKKCVYWQTEKNVQRVEENEKRRKVRRTTDAREILQKTLAAHQEAMRDI